jgi:hypothetical protein
MSMPDVHTCMDNLLIAPNGCISQYCHGYFLMRLGTFSAAHSFGIQGHGRTPVAAHCHAGTDQCQSPPAHRLPALLLPAHRRSPALNFYFCADPFCFKSAVIAYPWYQMHRIIDIMHVIRLRYIENTSSPNALKIGARYCVLPTFPSIYRLRNTRGGSVNSYEVSTINDRSHITCCQKCRVATMQLRTPGDSQQFNNNGVV